MKNKKLKINHWLSKRGFSMIELVFAMSFLTLIIFGVVSLQSSNLALINRQNNQIQAHFYANQGIQIVKSIGYSGISCNPPQTPCEKGLSKSGNKYSLGNTPEQIGTTPFKRTILINDTGLTDAYLIRSIIEWTDSTGEHSRTADNSHVEAKIIIYN